MKETPGTNKSDAPANHPSSVTTAGETADLTLATMEPPRDRRRDGGERGGGTRRSPSLHRQYNLLRSQIFLLLGSASVGLVLFLFYALPLAAFVSLALMASSIGALFPALRSIALARYELEMERPGGLTRYLPDALRVMLTETSLHEFMTDDAFFMEYRYLMLYFVPGLRPEQVMDFIGRLPPRHRDALMRPGLGMLMPSVMENFMRIDGEGSARADPVVRENDGDDVSNSSSLAAGREHRWEGDETDGADDEVTLLEVVTGIGQTLAGIASDNEASPGDVEFISCGDSPPNPLGARQSSQSPFENTTRADPENRGDDQDDDNSSIAFSIELSAQGLGDAHDAPVVSVLPASDSRPRNVIVEMPHSDVGPNQSSDINEEQIQQQERELEGRILSEAASAAVANFSAQATTAASEVAVTTVVTTSSWGIRAGTVTGLVAGGGGILATLLANRGATVPLLVNLGIASGSTRTADTARSSAGSANDGSSGNGNDVVLEHQNGSSQWIRGLFVTSAFGFAGAGVAYLIRNRARVVIAENRDKRLLESPSKEEKDD